MSDEIIEPEVKEPELPEPEKEEEEQELPESSLEDTKQESESESESELTPEPVKVEIPDDGLAKVEGETPREHALRLEVKRLRDDKTKERSKELFEPPKSEPVKIESEVLKKYKLEEIQALREVLPELAKELGYIRKDELNASTYDEKAQEQIDAFLTTHPEYSPEKDPEGVLWNKLKLEYQTVYKSPQNPKDFKKIFERIHKDLFGIQAIGALTKIAAANEKVKVASHAGAPTQGLQRSKNVSGSSYRFDALKGFSDEELASMQSQAEE